MNAIPLTDADGSDGQPICRKQREWLVSRYKNESLIALKFFSDDLGGAERDVRLETKAIKHVRKCQKCRDWLDRIVPADVLARQSRISRYCCICMFAAFEETAARSKYRITFSLFRGEEPCWMIGGVRGIIFFCPWCGKKLPAKPFISES